MTMFSSATTVDRPSDIKPQSPVTSQPTTQSQSQFTTTTSTSTSTTTPPSSPPSTFDLSNPKTTTAIQRTLTHMTADHADSLALFLRHYCKLPASQIPLPPTPNTLQLTEITPNHLIITHPHGRNLVPISPPLSSISDARPRLIEMHNASLAGLDLSSIKVNTFVGPNKPWQYALHFGAFMTFFTFTFWPSSAFRPEAKTFPSLFWGVGGLAPWNARLASYVKNYVLVGMLVIHVAEVAWFARTRLRKYWVERFTALWWAWVGCVFLGGVAGITRFDEMVGGMERDAERRRGEAKH